MPAIPRLLRALSDDPKWFRQDPGGALGALAVVAVDVMDLGGLAVWLADSDGRFYCAARLSGADAAPPPGLLEPSVDRAELFEALNAGECHERQPVGAQTVATLAAPIQVLGRCMGFVELEHHGGPRSWKPGERKDALAVADIAAIVVNSLQNHQASQEVHDDLERRLRSVDRAPEREHTPEPSRATSDTAGRRILLAEDDPSLARFLIRVLERDSHSVVHVRDGAEAVQCIMREVFDLVVSDLVLPRLSGTEVVRFARRADPEQPVLLITGHDPGSVPIELPDVRILAKPFLPADLLASVAEVLEGS